MEYIPSYSDNLYADIKPSYTDSLMHHGIKGQKWGVRRYQNSDGSYTSAGKKRRGLSKKTINNLKEAGKALGTAAVIGGGMYLINKQNKDYANIDNVDRNPEKFVSENFKPFDKVVSRQDVDFIKGIEDLERTYKTNPQSLNPIECSSTATMIRGQAKAVMNGCHDILGRFDKNKDVQKRLSNSPKSIQRRYMKATNDQTQHYIDITSRWRDYADTWDRVARSIGGNQTY